MSALNSTILQSLSDKDSQLIAGAVGLAAALAAAAVYYTFGFKARHDFPKLPGVQLYHAWNFFRARYDFLTFNVKLNRGGFSFNILHHNMVVLTGDEARQMFLSNPHLSMSQGYMILLGITPKIGDVDIATEENEDGKVSLLNKKLLKLMSQPRLEDMLPSLQNDIFVTANKWGNSGRVDPFTDIYDLVFLMTARLAVCDSLTKNEDDLHRIKELFHTIHTGATPASLLLPWFPSPARKSVKRATTEMYTLLQTYVEARRHADPTNDAVDVLIADGVTTQNIIGFIMATLVAGIVTTGIVSGWMLIDLAIHSEWREKCKKEIRELLSRHSDSAFSLCERLRDIPISAWEDELPILDACIRESQRLVITGTLLRRNVRGDVKVGGRVVQKGDFLAYSTSDVHFNPEYYPEPLKYDPDRWLRPKATPDAAYQYIGWGAGRHLCTGMRFAKLEMKLILTVFLMRYDYKLVDKYGKFPDSLPVPNRNDTHQAFPIGTKLYFDIKKVVE